MDNKQLIQQCAVGDKESIDRLYRRYGASMLRVILRYVPDEARAEDILHDGFIVILTRINEVRQPERLEYWMGTVMKNLCLKYLSEVDVVEILEDENEVPDIPPIDDILSYDELQIIINRLPEGYRRIFKLAVLEGMSHKEIGRMLGIAPHSSSSQLRHARILLQQMIMERKRELGIITMLLLAAGLWFLVNQSGLRKATDMVARTDHVESVDELRVVETEQPEGPVLPSAIPSVQPDKPRVGRPLIAAIAPSGSAVDVDTMTTIAAVVPPSSSGEKADTATSKPAKTINKSTADTTVRRPTPSRLPNEPVDRRYRTPRHFKPTHIAQAGGLWSVGLHGMGAAGLASGSGMKFNDAAAPGDNLNKPDTVPSTETNPAAVYARPLRLSPDVEQVAMRTGEPEHEIPLTFGLSVERRVSSRLSIESGVSYTLLRTRLNYYGAGMNIIRNVRSSYIGVPLKLNYRLFERSAFSVYGTVGGAIDIPVGSQFATRTEKPLNSSIVFPHLSSRTQFSMLGGIGVQYSVTPRLGLYFEPSLRYYFNNHSSMPTYWQEHPWSFSLPIGLRFTW